MLADELGKNVSSATITRPIRSRRTAKRKLAAGKSKKSMQGIHHEIDL